MPVSMRPREPGQVWLGSGLIRAFIREASSVQRSSTVAGPMIFEAEGSEASDRHLIARENL